MCLILIGIFRISRLFNIFRKDHECLVQVPVDLDHKFAAHQRGQGGKPLLLPLLVGDEGIDGFFSRPTDESDNQQETADQFPTEAAAVFLAGHQQNISAPVFMPCAHLTAHQRTAQGTILQRVTHRHLDVVFAIGEGWTLHQFLERALLADGRMQKPLPQFHEHDDRIAVAHGSIFFCPCPHIIAEASFPTVVTEGPDACILLGKRVHLLDDDIHHGEGCGRVGCLVERMAKAVIVVVGLDQVGERVTDVVTALPCPADAPADLQAL